MIPVFKSTYSIGKSILTLDEDELDGGPDSILSICEEHNIKSLVLVEDSMTGFVTAHNRCRSRDIDLVFGLRLTCCNDIETEDNSDHKIVIGAPTYPLDHGPLHYSLSKTLFQRDSK